MITRVTLRICITDSYNFILKIYLCMEYNAIQVDHILQIVNKKYFSPSMILFRGFSRVTHVTLL